MSAPTASAGGPPSPRTGPPERHHLVDALRGTALLGILAVNAEFLLQHPDVGWSARTTAADLGARWLVTTFGELKVYPVFAMLFGYGLSVQLGRAAPGAHHGRRHARRMLALAVLGTAHAVLFFPGDVLVVYALVGSCAYLLRRRTSRSLVRLAAVTYACASAAWLVVAGLAALTGDDLSTPVPAASVRVLADGTFGEVVGQHLAQWPGTLALLLLVQGPAAFAAVLIGVALGRTDVLADPAAHRGAALRVLAVAAPPALVVGGLGAAMALSGGRLTAAGLAVGFLVAPATSAAYVAAAMLLWGRRRSGARPGAGAVLVESAGRMSLSVYLLESVVVSTLSYGYGLGLFGTLGPCGGLLVALAVWLGLCLLAVGWLRRFDAGPVERALRTVVRGRWRSRPHRGPEGGPWPPDGAAETLTRSSPSGSAGAGDPGSWRG